MFSARRRRQRRLFGLKVVAFLSLIRWYNLLVVAVGQYLGALRLFNPSDPWQEDLLDLELHLVVLSTALNLAGGFLINAFYDLEKDLINRPATTYFGRLVSAKTCLRSYFFFNFAALGFAWTVGDTMAAASAGLTFGLWFYSHKLKRLPLLGNLTSALLTVAAFLMVALYYGDFTPMTGVYVAFILLVSFIRELVKDIEALKGDFIYGYQTIPVRYGTETAKRWLYLLMILILGPFGATYALMGLHPIFFSFGACLLIGIYTGLQIYRAQSKRDYQRVAQWLKALVLIGMSSIVLL